LISKRVYNLAYHDNDSDKDNDGQNNNNDLTDVTLETYATKKIFCVQFRIPC